MVTIGTSYAGGVAMEGQVSDIGALIFGVLAIVLIVVVLIREVLCWYWKVNRIVTLLESIDRKLTPHREESPS